MKMVRSVLVCQAVLLVLIVPLLTQAADKKVSQIGMKRRHTSKHHHMPPPPNDCWTPLTCPVWLQYVEAFSKVPWQEFPGGRYKVSTSKTLTATTIAGTLTELKPGGVRELHWHDAVEWALVISGTCL